MTTNLSKRALFSAGALSAGVGAMALLSQRAAADTPFTSFAFPASGAPVPRTMPDRLADVRNVKDFGAVGDGLADDTAAIQACLDAAFGPPSSPNGNNLRFKNRPVFFPAGSYKISSPLMVRSVASGYIFGAGGNCTRIFSTQENGVVFHTNGFANCRVENLNFAARPGGICFNLDWDGTGSISLHANTFIDCLFEGGNYGILIGDSGFMGSENIFLGCTWNSHALAAMRTANWNALSQTIIGGGAANCGRGFWAVTGTITLIASCAFAENGYDIAIHSGDCCTITACRTESVNFLDAAAGIFTISSCIQNPPNAATNPGYFINNLNGECLVSSCISTNGAIGGQHGPLDLRGCSFRRADYLDSFNGPALPTGERSIRESKTSSFAITRAFSGREYDNRNAGGPVTFTLPALNNESASKGTKFGFFVATAQQVRIVATNNMTIRVGSSISGSNGVISSNAVGTYIELEALDGEGPGQYATTWFAKSVVGNWTIT